MPMNNDNIENQRRRTSEHSPDSRPSVHFQFEVLTLCVWGFQFFLFYHFLQLQRHGHPDFTNLAIIAALNVLPWAIGLLQWKKAANLDSTQEGCSRTAAQQAIVYVLASAYFALMNIESLWLFS